MNIKLFASRLFNADYDNYQDVPRINLYVMRIFFALMFLLVGRESWSTIINNKEPWEPMNAVVFSVWAAYSALSFIGIFRTLKMLPIMLFMVFYKAIWLIIVAYPLWATDKLAGSSAGEMAKAFIWVVIPVAFMPWKYVFKTYFWSHSKSNG
jgi:hypothetical protein